MANMGLQRDSGGLWNSHRNRDVTLIARKSATEGDSPEQVLT